MCKQTIKFKLHSFPFLSSSPFFFPFLFPPFSLFLLLPFLLLLLFLPYPQTTVEAFESRIEALKEQEELTRVNAQKEKELCNAELTSITKELKKSQEQFEATHIQLEEFKKHAGVDSTKQLEDLVALSLEVGVVGGRERRKVKWS